MIVPLLVLDRLNRVDSRITILLICIMVALLYIHGEHHIQCISILPDEIMDLPCRIGSRISDDNTHIFLQFLNQRKDLSLTEIKTFLVSTHHRFKYTFLFECLSSDDAKKRLFLLENYKSWNTFSSNLLCSLSQCPFSKTLVAGQIFVKNLVFFKKRW